MKPTVPEIGTVIRTEGDRAEVLLKGEHSCKGCGAAAIGLCRASGASMTATVKNSLYASTGDRVVISLDRKSKLAGYFMAYIGPLIAFISGSVMGEIAGGWFSIKHLDLALGFSALAAALYYSSRGLRRLDRSASMKISRVISAQKFDPLRETEEEFLYKKMGGRF